MNLLNLKMKAILSSILLTILLQSFAQSNINATIENLNTVVVFHFIPNLEIEGYFCQLNSTIYLDSTECVFIPYRGANYELIRAHQMLGDELGVAESYASEGILTEFCLSKTKNANLENINCDSLLSIYAEHTIYDSVKYHEVILDPTTLVIRSEDIYGKLHNDTLYIALQFQGSVIHYRNLERENQSEHELQSPNNAFKELDDSEDHCIQRKYDSEIVVLNKVKDLSSLDSLTIEQFGFHKLERTELNFFIWE